MWSAQQGSAKPRWSSGQ